MRLIDIPPEQQAARIRAAIWYSGLEAQEVARRLGVSYPTLRRRYDRERPGGAASLDELHAIADICGVPRTFMEHGFELPREPTVTGRRLTRLEDDVQRLADELGRLRAGQAELTDDLSAIRQAIETLAEATGADELDEREAAPPAPMPARVADRSRARRRSAG